MGETRGRQASAALALVLLTACSSLQSSSGHPTPSHGVPTCPQLDLEVPTFRASELVFGASQSTPLRAFPSLAAQRTGVVGWDDHLIVLQGPVRRECAAWYRVMGVFQPPEDDPTRLVLGWIPVYDEDLGFAFAREEVVCEEPPLTAMELGLLEWRMAGPACYGDRSIVAIGFVAPTCGIDMRNLWQGEPEWLNGEEAGTAISDRELVDYIADGWVYGEAGGGLSRCGTPAGWYAFTGHFADRSADLCDTVYVTGGVATPLDHAMSRELCRARFVVTAFQAADPPPSPSPS